MGPATACAISKMWNTEIMITRRGLNLVKEEHIPISTGALSSWVRLKHPELFVGSIASSGPVLAQLDFYGKLYPIVFLVPFHWTVSHRARSVERMSEINRWKWKYGFQDICKRSMRTSRSKEDSAMIRLDSLEFFLLKNVFDVCSPSWTWKYAPFSQISKGLDEANKLWQTAEGRATLTQKFKYVIDNENILISALSTRKRAKWQLSSNPIINRAVIRSKSKRLHGAPNLAHFHDSLIGQRKRESIRNI